MRGQRDRIREQVQGDCGKSSSVVVVCAWAGEWMVGSLAGKVRVNRMRCVFTIRQHNTWILVSTPRNSLEVIFMVHLRGYLHGRWELKAINGTHPERTLFNQGVGRGRKS